MKNLLMIGAAVFALAACSEVPPGYVGVKIHKVFNAGIEKVPLTQGTHLLGIGEDIHSYPTKFKQYAYTRAPDERGNENEEITFNDSKGLSMTGDVQILAAARADCIPELYSTWLIDFDSIVDGPIWNDVKTEIAKETEKTTVDQLYAGSRQVVVTQALKALQAKWEPQCVSIKQLDWVGPIRYPKFIEDAIAAKTATDQATQNAIAQVAQKKAEADAAIEEARGVAESNRIRGAALEASPARLKQIYLDKWDGRLPQTILGGNTEVLMSMLPPQ